jgi:hypothetical protein
MSTTLTRCRVPTTSRPSVSGPAGRRWPRGCAGKSAATRRARLADLAKFVRWWAATAPGAGLWQVTEDVLPAYAEQLGTGGQAAALTCDGGLLADATVKRHVSTLKSLNGYAVRRRVIDHSPAAFVEMPEVGKVGTTQALALDEAAALVRGAQQIAQRHPVDAAAVMLLATCGRSWSVVAPTSCCCCALTAAASTAGASRPRCAAPPARTWRS